MELRYGERTSPRGKLRSSLETEKGRGRRRNGEVKIGGDPKVCRLAAGRQAKVRLGLASVRQTFVEEQFRDSLQTL